MKFLLRHLFVALLLTAGASSVSAQSLDQAKKLYNEGKYAEAMPAMEKLVQRSPGNTSYNQWYGVCLFETGDPLAAEKHLKIAANKKVQEAFKYLGQIYYDTYRFDLAEQAFETYIKMLEKKKLDASEYEHKLALAQRAQRLVNNTEDIQIIDSVVTDTNRFLSYYKLSEESGSLEPFNTFFESSAPVFSTVYMNQKGDKIYYARPDDSGNYALFTQTKQLDTFGDERKLSDNVNIAGNNNFPYVMGDGVTVYYGSTGNGSLGGYDIFATRYNMNNDSYLNPEPLGMPFNSPANDYMYVVDEAKGLGWFVTDRNQPEGKVAIYLFIPNQSRRTVQSDDDAYLRNRAMISSIAESWREGEDYSELVKLAYESAGSNKQKKDFEFIINDNIIYFTSDDFSSPKALELFEKAQSARMQVAEVERSLAELRKKYTEGNNSDKKQLQPAILRLEAQLEEMQNTPDQLEKEARNAEIMVLRKNQ